MSLIPNRTMAEPVDTTHLARVAVASATQSPERVTVVRSLANELELPIVDLSTTADGLDFLLCQTDSQLELRTLGSDAPGPIVVDFVRGATAFRLSSSSMSRQPIASAMGLSRGTATVVDATAGLARDAFLLASLGCRVIMVERNRVLSALIRDGLKRAQRGSARTKDAVSRMELVVGEAAQMLANLDAASAPDAVYLDPMYEPRSQKSLTKKEMRICRRLVGDDNDAAALLETARKVARRRVVVKRHRHASPLAPHPDLKIAAKQVRYDVYLTKGTN